MKIIHCSDIHLDSGMERNLTAEQAKERNAEICAAFGRMVRFARENHVEMILIAGDLFDTGRVSARMADFVLNQIRQTKTVEFFYLRGNHDESEAVFSGMELPENFRTFGPEWTYHRRGSLVITGMEPDGDVWESMYDSLHLRETDTNIVMLHGMESTRPGWELIAIPKLRGRHIHYLALGHIHSFKLEKLDMEGLCCYSGCLEGRGFDECGEKGFVLLDVQDRQIRAEFVPFAVRKLHETKVDISGLTTVTEIQAAMEAASAEIPSADLVKFVLTGSYTPETQKDLHFLEKMLTPLFWFVKIKDESRLQIDRGSFEHDISLKGEFVRRVLASDRSDAEKEMIISCGLRALAGGEVEL